MKTATFALMVLLTVGVQRPDPVASRMVEGGLPLTVLVPPLDASHLDVSLAAIAAASRTPLIIDHIVDFRGRASLGADTSGRDLIDFRGRSLGDAMTLILASPPPVILDGRTLPVVYRWEGKDGVLHVSSVPRQQSLLETLVSRFSVVNADVAAFMTAVHRIFDPAFKDVVFDNQIVGLSPVLSVDSQRGLSTRRITMMRTGLTLRQLLSDAALQFGELSWVFRYVTDPPAYESSMFGVSAFAGTQQWTTPRRTPPRGPATGIPQEESRQQPPPS